jgi:peptide/nickel transport system substrate-binding protein
MASDQSHFEQLVDDFVSRRIDRRQFFKQSAALGLSLPAVNALAAASAHSNKAAAAGLDKLSIRLRSDITNLDPAFSVNGFPATTILEGLVTFKPGTLEVVNQLAETFTPSSDGLSFHFTLKKGIHFHGNYGEVTSEDVKYSYERIAGLTKPKLDSPYSGDWAPALKEVKIKDKYSGIIILNQPFAPLMRSTLPAASGYVLSKKAVEERGKKFGTNPIGTGPYQFVSWTPMQRFVVKRFARYGGASKHFLGSPWKVIDFLPITDDNAADIALQTGSVDFGDISLPSVDRFRSNPNFHVVRQPTLNYDFIAMNMLHPKLSDIRVRKAIRLAVDVPGILQAAFEGKEPRATSIIPPNMGIGYWKDAPVYKRDVAGAKSLLAAAGVSNLGLTLTFTEVTGSKNLSQILQANLADVGINLSLNQVDAATFFATGKTLRDRELIYTFFDTRPDPSWSTVWFTCKQLDLYNYPYWCNKKYTSLHFAAIREPNVKKRSAMYIEMQKLWDAAANTIWIDWPARYFGARKGIRPSIYPTGDWLPQAFKAV